MPACRPPLSPRDLLRASVRRYAERDLHLYRLSDSDLMAEYARYTTIYLADETAHVVRGMAEMTVIKLGELAGGSTPPPPSPHPHSHSHRSNGLRGPPFL